jgi:hypothetical protein
MEKEVVTANGVRGNEGNMSIMVRIHWWQTLTKIPLQQKLHAFTKNTCILKIAAYF